MSEIDDEIAANAASVARAGDAVRRRDAQAAVVSVPLLMRALVEVMPSFDTSAERQAYIAAVKDIAIQVNAAVMDHDAETGELRAWGEHVSVSPSIVDEWL